MGEAERINLAGWALRATLWLASSTAIPGEVLSVQAQTSPPPPDVSQSSRIDRLERMLSTVAEENRRLAEEVRTLKEQAQRTPAGLDIPACPTLALPPGPVSDRSWSRRREQRLARQGRGRRSCSLSPLHGLNRVSEQAPG